MPASHRLIPFADSLRYGPIQPAAWLTALNNSDAFVRSAAVWRATQDPALARLAPLTDALSDPSLEVRGLAAAALCQLASKAAHALEPHPGRHQYRA